MKLYDDMGRQFCKLSMSMVEATAANARSKGYSNEFTGLVGKLLGRIKKSGKLKNIGRKK